MGFNLDTLLSGTRVVTVSLAGDSINATYKVDHFTPEKTLAFLERIRELGSGDAAYLERFCDAVIDWDVLSKGKKIPLTMESIAKVPWTIITTVWAAIEKDRAEGEATPKSQAA
jgi:hypothetical protein